MSQPKGFSKSKPGKTSPSPNAAKRKQAAKRYDEMQSKGMPEFNIFVRSGKAAPGKPNPWLPVGSLAVSRSSAIHQAIFQNEEELKKAALRLFPRLSKVKEDLEFGFRLKDKDYQDEPIQLAIRPQPSPVQVWMEKIRGWLHLSGKGNSQKA
ncbi:MAG: HHL1-like protein [Cyanobacteriota bacterium]